MTLRLYKEPYADPSDPHKTRILFEGKLPAGGMDVDFFLFVWIRNNECIDSFQAILDNDLVLSCVRLSRLILGRISESRFGRSIQGPASDEDKQRMQHAMADLKSRYFSDLLAKVEQIARGAANIDWTLNAVEQRYFGELVSGRR